MRFESIARGLELPSSVDVKHFVRIVPFECAELPTEVPTTNEMHLYKSECDRIQLGI